MDELLKLANEVKDSITGISLRYDVDDTYINGSVWTAQADHSNGGSFSSKADCPNEAVTLLLNKLSGRNSR